MLKMTLADGVEYKFAPLTLNQLQLHEEDLNSIRGDRARSLNTFSPPADFDPLRRVVLTSLRRFHPDLTLDQIGDLIDLSNWLDTYHMVHAISGGKSAPGESQG